jgi:hypothetical protein
MKPFLAQANPPCRPGEPGKALQLVGDQLPKRLYELNEVLAA